MAREANGQAVADREWLLLVYKMAREPARQRIAVWRQLKALGAVYLQQGVCALPATAANDARLAVLSVQIRAAAGEAMLLRSRIDEPATAALVRARYDEARAHEYGEIATAVRRLLRHVERGEPGERAVNAAELERLKRWYARVVARDHFGSPQQQATGELLQATEAALRGEGVAADAAADA